MYTIYMINMQQNLALGLIWAPIDTDKTENPDISQQNFQAQTVFPLKKRVKTNHISQKPKNCHKRTVRKETEQTFLSVSVASVQEYNK